MVSGIYFKILRPQERKKQRWDKCSRILKTKRKITTLIAMGEWIEWKEPKPGVTSGYKNQED